MKLLTKFARDYQTLVDNVGDWRNRDDLEHIISLNSSATRAYKIRCTGDACKGDQVLFIKRIWERQSINKFGKLANVVVGYELVEGEIIADSYGSDKQQHTFTIKTGKDKMLIKGRNLYAIGVWRKSWKDEDQRKTSLDEKHERGSSARRERAIRRNEYQY